MQQLRPDLPDLRAGQPRGGCHPIMLKEEIVRYEGNDLVIDLDGLSAYKDLFLNVADH